MLNIRNRTVLHFTPVSCNTRALHISNARSKSIQKNLFENQDLFERSSHICQVSIMFDAIFRQKQCEVLLYFSSSESTVAASNCLNLKMIFSKLEIYEKCSQILNIKGHLFVLWYNIDNFIIKKQFFKIYNILSLSSIFWMYVDP